MAFLFVLLTLLTIWLFSNLTSLYQNYRRALISHLPIVICLGNPDNYLWMVLSVPLRITLEKLLPKRINDSFIKPAIYGWEFRDKYALHREVGPVFLLVNPGEMEMWIADPGVAQVVLARRKDFVQAPIASKIMNILGPNLITSDGDVWARQRRLIAPNLNERISEVVWSESSVQAAAMTQHLLSQPQGKTKSTIEGLRSIAMNVLGQAGYGQPQHWSAEEETENVDGKMTYFDAVSRVINLLVPAAILPAKVLRMSFMPNGLRKLGQAIEEYPGHTTTLLNKERVLASESGEERSNLLAMLARLSDGDGKDSGNLRLSAEEIQGNLFLFTAAGFDTTANTMAYAVTLLAANPKLQAWIFEELDRVLPVDPTAEVDYKKVFPQLIRCLALMYETLRVYPAVIHISRYIRTTQTIKTTNSTHTIQAPAKIYINVAGLHLNTETWGPDALKFNPGRWIPSSPEASEANALVTPAKGTFLPWSGGPRICPGMKMAQVEFVAVIATLFRYCKAEVVLREGETERQAKERLEQLMQESQPRLTLQIENPEDVVLRWVKR